MELLDAIKKRRSVRRFKQKVVEESLLEQLIDSARFAPSAGNMQRLRYVIVRKPELVEQIFKQTAWAAFVQPRRNPELGKSAPLVFIAVTAPLESPEMVVADAGAAIQNIQLRAIELGLGCCWIGSFKKEETGKILGISSDMKILYLLAVGYPDETPVWEDIDKGDSTKYYLDENDCLHVPKYTVESITEWL